MNMSKHVRSMNVAAMFLALGLLLPMVFHFFGPNAGSMFLPMHIPVLLCGFVCGPFYGALIGILTPLLSSTLTGMPMLMPIGVSMMFELMVYGLISGLLMKRYSIYPSLLIAMLSGRIASGIATMVLLSFAGKAYSLTIFLSAAFVTALPGILLQLLVVPMVVQVIKKLNPCNN